MSPPPAVPAQALQEQGGENGYRREQPTAAAVHPGDAGAIAGASSSLKHQYRQRVAVDRQPKDTG